jgi:hypothetical protein
MTPTFARLLEALEPLSSPLMTEYAPSSIAMSLKRIADALERMADTEERLLALYLRLYQAAQTPSPEDS